MKDQMEKPWYPGYLSIVEYLVAKWRVGDETGDTNSEMWVPTTFSQASTLL